MIGTTSDPGARRAAPPTTFRISRLAAVLVTACGLAPLRGQDAEPPADTPPPAAGASAASAPLLDLAPLVERASRRFVRVAIAYTPTGEPAPGARPGVAISGLLLDDEGHVLTVGEELEGARVIEVQSFGEQVALAEVVGIDTMMNVGVVAVPALDAPPLEVRSRRELFIGQPVIGLGNSFDLGRCLAVGHVTGLGRALRTPGSEFRDLLQVSLPMNPGDQGGPVFDLEGRVAAMLLTRYRHPEESEPGASGPAPRWEPQGIAFAMPIEKAIHVAQQLILRRAHVERPEQERQRPYLGVRVTDLEDPVLRAQLALEDSEGIVVELVFRGSPAHDSGLQAHDVLVRFSGAAVRSTQHLGELLRSTHIGQSVPVVVLRQGDPREFQVTIGARY